MEADEFEFEKELGKVTKSWDDERRREGVFGGWRMGSMAVVDCGEVRIVPLLPTATN